MKLFMVFVGAAIVWFDLQQERSYIRAWLAGK